LKFVQGGSGKAPQAFRAQPETGGEAAETAEGGLPAAPRLPAGRKPAEESNLSPQKPETNTN